MKIKLSRTIFPIGILMITIIFTILTVNKLPQKKTIEIFPVQANDMIATQEANFLKEETETLTVSTSKVIQEKIAIYPEYIFEPISQIAYALEDIDIKLTPYDNSEKIDILKKYEEVNLTGQNDFTYWEITLNNNNYYINQTKITTDKSVIEEMKEQERIAEEKRKAEEEARKKREELQKQTQSYTWDGGILTPTKGVNYGPQGKETYYNLPMEGVIKIMRNRGFSEEEYPYWIRDDGCKMLGDYIIVAANLDTFPRGSIIECSLGTAIVCDTGGFAKRNPTQLDIAVNW